LLLAPGVRNVMILEVEWWARRWSYRVRPTMLITLKCAAHGVGCEDYREYV